MKMISNILNSQAIRTYFKEDSLWEEICTKVNATNEKYGFKANVQFVNDTEFSGLTKNQIAERIPSEFTESFIFIIDELTFTHEEHPVLCVDLFDSVGDAFRVVPSSMWDVESNLSIGNLDFEEYKENLNKDGIYRGFE